MHRAKHKRFVIHRREPGCPNKHVMLVEILIHRAVVLAVCRVEFFQTFLVLFDF